MNSEGMVERQKKVVKDKHDCQNERLTKNVVWNQEHCNCKLINTKWDVCVEKKYFWFLLAITYHYA